jgi:alkylmercury lyase
MSRYTMKQDPIATLPDRLARRPEAAIAAIARPLLRLLGEGEPVRFAELARVAGLPEETAERMLAAMPDAELDQDGRIVGLGLTLRPTPHVLELDGRRLFAWCAIDTLMFPSILGRPLTIVSPCRATGRAIRVRAEAGRVIESDPAEAVVSVVGPDELSRVRGAFCDRVHFFSSEAAAAGWLRDNPDGPLLGVQHALDLGESIARAIGW